MTTVFLLLWLADVSEYIKTAGFICAFVLCIAVIIDAFVVSITEELPLFWKFVKNLKSIYIVIFISLITPSQKTIQLFALSYAGEAAVETKLGKKGLEAIESVFEKIINETKGKK